MLFALRNNIRAVVQGDIFMMALKIMKELKAVLEVFRVIKKAFPEFQFNEVDIVAQIDKFAEQGVQIVDNLLPSLINNPIDLE
jgi:hypothetical protein